MNFVQPIKKKSDIEAIKRVLFSNNMRDYALFTLGINSGLRISDILELNVEDVLDSDKGIQICDRIQIKEKKTGKTNDFILNISARSALKEYLLKANLPPGSPLFPSRKGGGTNPITRNQAYTLLRNAIKEAGLRLKAGTHTMRKTFAYHKYKKGVEIEILAKLLNHSSPAITMRYIGLEQEMLDKIVLQDCL